MIHNLLVIRFSALGDVAMTVPTLKQLATQYPDLQISVLSNFRYAALFDNLPENIHFLGADLKGKHNGISGINQLLKEIDYQKFDAVADFHNVLRSRYIDMRLQLKGARVAIFDKQRISKWQLTRRYHKVIRPIETVIDLQKDVLKTLGLPINSSIKPQQPCSEHSGIGIAPFAAHESKIYPLQLMEQVVEQLSARANERVLLFGAGEKEIKILQSWADKYSNVENTAGQYSMSEEIEIMSSLRVMLTMDSANMHLASLAGTRVVSIWGATHPYAGFTDANQNKDDYIQTELLCRPCSIYGNKQCRYGDYRCLTMITPNDIINKLIL